MFEGILGFLYNHRDLRLRALANSEYSFASGQVSRKNDNCTLQKSDFGLNKDYGIVCSSYSDVKSEFENIFFSEVVIIDESIAVDIQAKIFNPKNFSDHIGTTLAY